MLKKLVNKTLINRIFQFTKSSWLQFFLSLTRNALLSPPLSSKFVPNPVKVPRPALMRAVSVTILSLFQLPLGKRRFLCLTNTNQILSLNFRTFVKINRYFVCVEIFNTIDVSNNACLASHHFLLCRIPRNERNDSRANIEKYCRFIKSRV